MSHCRHPSCCQCGAVRGTPKHDAECIDAIAMRELAALNERRGTPRKLYPRKAQP